MNALLDVSGLTAAYGRAQVLFGVTLRLRPGEVVALMGRNGAGKSTTLKAIMGVLPPTGGTVWFEGRAVTGWEPFRVARLGLGYVPEERRIFTDLTVMENLEVGRKVPADGRAAWTPEKLFSIFPNLAEMRGPPRRRDVGRRAADAHHRPHPDGQPHAVLLDEPSEGLAPVIVEQMADAVLRMKREGIAVLLSEQNLSFAGAVSDRAYVIEKGAIHFEGTMAALEADEAVREAYLTV